MHFNEMMERPSETLGGGLLRTIICEQYCEQSSDWVVWPPWATWSSTIPPGPLYPADSPLRKEHNKTLLPKRDQTSLIVACGAWQSKLIDDSDVLVRVSRCSEHKNAQLIMNWEVR